MEDKGWISIHRKILDNPLFTEKREFSKFEAWMDILLNVNHKEADVIIKNEVIKCGRGQSLLSYESWGKRWNWSKSRVSRYLNFIQDMNMIRIENVKKTTRLTVCNYDSYQDSRNASETQVKRKRNASETQVKPNNNNNNNNNENNDNNENNLSNVIVADARKKTIEDRVKDFKESLYQYTIPRGGKYEPEMVRKFFEHYSELTPGGKKMLWETFKTFQIAGRLKKWSENDINFNKNGKQQNTNTAKQSVNELGKLADAILANAGQNNTTDHIF